MKLVNVRASVSGRATPQNALRGSKKLLPRKEKEGTYAMEWGGEMKGKNAHGDTGNMTGRAAGHTQPPD